MQEFKRGLQLASRYTLVRKLGAGGGAETWLATDRLSRASVAVKILTDARIPTEALHREWQLSIRLVHAHIARVFEFHGEDDTSFYTMQFVDGPDISVLSGAPLDDILPPFTLLADALRYAHGKGVVHRDLKSANVLLDGNGAPFLIDFGVAASGRSRVGGGSLIAATPQSLAGAEPQPADDVFALGGLLYELIRGRSPYSSASTADDIRLRVPEALVASDGSPLPEWIAGLVAAMLDKDPVKRPDVAEVVTTIEAAGYAPAPARAKYVSGVGVVADEIIASSGPRRRADQTSAPEYAQVDRGDGGVRPRTLAIALAASLALLLGVVFLLPKSVDNSGDAPLPNADTSVESQAEPAEAPAADERAPQRDERVTARMDAEEVLGRLLARMRTLEGRAVQRWGGLPFRQAERAYEAGDAAYLEADYESAREKYEEALDLVEPLLSDVDVVFRRTMTEAEAALENGDTTESLRLYELAVAISPSHGPAIAGLARARSLDEVLSLTEQGLQLERDLELEAARASFEQAVELDPHWTVAKEGLDRVLATMKSMEFDQRMTEGLLALSEGDYLAARAAFRMAQQLRPGSPEPADGLLQVDQDLRLASISTIGAQAAEFEQGEQWQAAAEAYKSILELDGNLTFAQEGLDRAGQMTALHKQLDDYIDDPDSLSSPRAMQLATNLVVDITRMDRVGPRLTDQRDELTRLLKRAATPLTVELVSDNLTEVSIYKVGRLGNFNTTELSLRPGTYVAVGSRPGFRDVRLEFRVAPEIDMQPVIVQCEERI